LSASLESTIREANRAILVERDLDAIERFFAHDYLVHITDRKIGGGLDAVRGFARMLLDAFPAIEVEVEMLAEAGDRIAWQRTLRGVHDGPFMGFPATHRHLVWRDMVTSRFEDGLIAEDWSITDLAERLLLARRQPRG
jgi:predicted ester cyclase